jgi:TonB family protein
MVLAPARSDTPARSLAPARYRRVPVGTRFAARLAAPASVALAACGNPAPRPEPAPRISAVPVTRVAAEEPEPDDGVQVVAAKGHMDPRAVEAGVAPHRAELTGCYTQRVGRRRWLGGHVLLRWEVAADGTVTRVLLADSDLGAWPVEKCLLDIARTLSFGKPIGGGAAELTLPFEFSTKGQPATWDIEQSARAIGGQLTKLAACAKGKVAAPEEVAITLYVGPHGRAESVGFASTTTALDDAWAACAEKAALAWRLPDPKGQVTKLAVRYRPR